MKRPAVFLDRDGTLIEPVPYLADPEKVRLLPGAATALRRLRFAGFACVLVTNQSAIGRGWMTEEDYEAVAEALDGRLRGEGIKLDGTYYCPVAPEGSDRRTVEHPDRKPGPGMLLRAARELRLDIARSWMVGDMLSDALAGRNAGCKGTILVRTGEDGEGHEAVSDPAVDHLVADLTEAAKVILKERGAPRRPR